MTDAQRNAASAQAQPWQFVFYTSFPQYDPANALFVDGLANELEINVQFETRNNFVQFDQSAGTYTLPADSNTTAWWSNSCLQVEYLHTTERRRQDMVKIYGHPDGLRYLFNDFQVGLLNN